MAAGARPIHHQPEDADSAHRPSGEAAERLTPLKELQLVEKHRAGGPGAQAALGTLLQTYQRRIYSICLRMVRNPDEAADLTQDALIKVIEGLAGYGGRSKVSTWVIRVTINCCLSHIRRQKIRSHESLDAGRELMQTWGGDVPGSASPRSAVQGGFSGISGSREPTQAQRIEQDQARAVVIDALDSLDADTRAILVLRDLQELDYQQLAEVLDIPVGTVKSRLFRARAAMRHAIDLRGGVKGIRFSE